MSFHFFPVSQPETTCSYPRHGILFPDWAQSVWHCCMRPSVQPVLFNAVLPTCRELRAQFPHDIRTPLRSTFELFQLAFSTFLQGRIAARLLHRLVLKLLVVPGRFSGVNSQMVSTECQHRLNNVYFHLLEDFRASMNLSGPGSLWLLASNRNTSAPCTFPASHPCAERPGAPNCNSRPPSGCPSFPSSHHTRKALFF